MRLHTRAGETLATLILGTALAAPAAAQNASDAVSLETIEVEARALGDGTDERADTYRANTSTAASRIPSAVKEVPFSLSTATRQRLNEEMRTEDASAIGRMTGMNLGGSDFAPGISSRGFSTLSNIDGLRMESEDSNFLPIIDSHLLESIEVMRGPAGLLEGAGQPGGVANRRLKRPFDTLSAEATLSLGSDAFRRATLDLSSPMNAAGTVRGRFAAAITDRDFFYDVADQDKIALLGSVEADLSDSTTVRLNALYQKDDRIPFWGVVGHEDGTLLDIDRSTFLGSRHGTFISEYTMISGEVVHTFDNGWTAKAMGNAFNHNESLRDYMPLYPAHESGGDLLTDVSLNVMNNPETGHNFDVSMSGGFDLFGRTHKAVFGASYIASNLKVDERWSFTDIPTHIRDPDTDLPIDIGTDGGVQQDRDYRQYGVYGQVNLRVTDKLTAIGGGRLNWARMESDITGPILLDYEENAFFTPLIGLVYDLAPAIALYASYADIYEPQFQRDRDGNVLKPMTGTQYEAGVKASLFDDRLAASFAVFDITRRNDAQRVGPFPSRIFEAVGETNSKGFEVEVSGKLTPGWNLFAGYAYTDHVVVEGGYSSFPGQIASNTPRHKFNLWTSYRFQQPALERWQVAAGLTAASAFYDWSNDYKAPGYVAVDAAVNYKVSETIDLSLKVTNLLDEVYYERLGSGGTGNYFGQPRSFMLEVRGRL